MLNGRPEKELNRLARDIVQQQVFLSVYIREADMQMLGMIFMPLGLGALADMSEAEVNDIGVVYEYYDKAGPRSVNGYPIFFSCHIISRQDWEYVVKKVDGMREAMKAIMGEVDDEAVPSAGGAAAHEAPDEDPLCGGACGGCELGELQGDPNPVPMSGLPVDGPLPEEACG